MEGSIKLVLEFLIAGVSKELLSWLFIAGTTKLTFSFFPRINFSSETRILLLYPTVPGLTFKAMSLGNI